MREILFRGKRLDNKKWIQGYLFQIWEQTFIVWGTTNGNPNMIVVDPLTVGQFTGLTDKNGKKIFEGDIVKWDEKEWGKPFSEIVTWDYELFNMRKSDWKEHCEVIGTIHDKAVNI